MFNSNISGEKLISRAFEIACLGLLIRSIAVGADMGVAISIVSIVSSICYKQWLIKDKLTDKQELENKIAELNQKIEESHQLAELHIKEVASKIQAVSMGQGIKRNQPNEQVQQAIEPTGISKRFF